jgi:hypothetical protein
MFVTTVFNSPLLFTGTPQEVRQSSALSEASASTLAALKKQLDSLNSELMREKEREQAARSQVGGRGQGGSR